MSNPLFSGDGSSLDSGSGGIGSASTTGLGDQISGNWDPGAVQQMIYSALQECLTDLKNGNDASFAIAHVMYLMQEYGGQTVGQAAETQGAMNKYIQEAQQVWAIINCGETTDDKGLDNQLDSLLTAMASQIQNDPFFKNDPTREKMAQNIISTLNEVDKLVMTCGESLGPGQSGIYNIWKQFDPGGGKQGDTTLMDALTRQLGQVNQDFTGESSAVGAEIKDRTKNYQGEQDVFNNFLRAINKLLQFSVQLERTS